MPFDIPEGLDFDVTFEDTRMADKKYVINQDTGQPLGIVGKSFQCASHGDFFRGVVDTATETLSDQDLDGAKYEFKTARNGAWAMLDITLPNVTSTIQTDKFETSIGNRIISLHGIDGSCSNQVFFGAIDFFCTNGMITGDHDKVRKKNTANFSMNSFIYELNRARTDFYQQAEQMQVWAQTSLKYVDVSTLLDDMLGSKRKAEKMYGLYMNEVATRGNNKFALYSAMTNYATYADERNGFNLRSTGNDTQAISMWTREQEVSKWVSDDRFRLLEAA
jgi:hypothetical protein|tara:strand:- start:228 stop:1058 length:831 start_codon:yes stop_codon:yes gene_type:complete